MKETGGRASTYPRRRTVLALTGGAVAVGLPLLPDPVAGASAWLTALFLLLSIVVGYGVFRSIRSLVGGTWGSAFTSLPIAGRTFGAVAFTFVVLLAGTRWAQGPAVPESPFHSVWFAWPWWLLRAALFPALWGYLLYGRASRGDADAHRPRGAALFLSATVLTFWLAVVDWQMLFIPEWNSTLFPFYRLFGTLPAAVGAAGLMGVRSGPPGGGEQTGRLAVFFTTLWAYLWFCQYLLVWYAGIPAEAHYWLVRTSGGWESLTFATPLVGWLLPFVLLLPAAMRRRRPLASLAYSAILLGHWLDLYLVWQPQARPSPWPWVLVDCLPALLPAWFLFARPGSSAYRPPEV